MKLKTISLINKKGGVGKSTITVNLAYALAESCDLRVLVIDNDDQGNDTQFFNVDPEKSLTDILLGQTDIRDVVQHTRYPKIDIVASDASLLAANVTVVKNEEIIQHNILKEALSKVEDQYDICLIDNPPTINTSVINALVASDDVIVVTTPHIFSIRGVDQMMEYIDEIKEYNPNLRIRGCLFNFFSSTQNGYKSIEALEKYPLFKTRLRYTKDKLDASAEERKSIFEYSPRCGFARDLVKFLGEFLKGE